MMTPLQSKTKFTEKKLLDRNLAGPIAGQIDAFVSKYDASGNLIWIRQIGTPLWDGNLGVTVDPFGNIFVSGHTNGNLGAPNSGERDVYVIKYDSDGNILWIHQSGTPDGDYSSGVATDSTGNVFISGWTWGSLDGSNAGHADAFVAKYEPPLRILEAVPTLDALADFSDGGANLVDDGSVISVQNVTFAEIDRRGVLEFDVSTIPDAAMITSAVLELDIILKSGSGDNQPVLYLHGYEGNGTLEISDGHVPLNLIGQSAPVLSLEVITINLDTDYIRSLLPLTDYLGLLILGDENGTQAGFVTTEGQIPDIRFAPKLTIQYCLRRLASDVAPEGGDCSVNFFDWAVFANAWQTTSDPPSPNWNPNCDIAPPGGDGLVDIYDFAVFTNEWLQSPCD